MNTYEEKFAYNISALRTHRGLTQRQFAELLGYSEKAISKWECNGSIPNIDTLYKIAAIFGVGLDELFRDKHTYLLGIDGGGTKTDFVLTDENFNIIKKVKLEGSNPIDIGLNAACEILQKGIYEVCGDIPFSSIVMFAGIAGGSSGGTKEELKKFFEKFGFKKFENGSDTQNIVSAAIGEDDGVIVIMGTGSCAIAQHDGIQERVSGWGYLFDDGGSGYSIARDALAALFRYTDGSGEHTMFADEVMKNYKSEQELLGALYAGGKKIIASFCPVVFECANKNDSICYEIVKKNMHFSAKIIKTAARKIKTSPIKIVAAGGLSNDSLAMKLLSEALADEHDYNIAPLGASPVEGALAYAKKLSNKYKETNS